MSNLAEYAIQWQRDHDLIARMYPDSVSHDSNAPLTATIKRSPFQHDRDRIIHCAAFRRLMFKTQVFVFIRPNDDHYRTRLTHTIEVAQMARSLARGLCVDEDLAEAIALAHDLGHPPFGHAGEGVLDHALRDQGGFDHNVQTFRIVTSLERRYLDFDGLNLSRATLEGIIKHNGSMGLDYVPTAIARFCQNFKLNLTSEPSIEAQIAGISDDLAYNSHDLDDGLRAGLFALEDALEIPLLAHITQQLRKKYTNPPADRLQAEIIREFIHISLSDVCAESLRNLKKFAPRDAQSVAKLPQMMVRQSADLAATHAQLKSFLRQNMYLHEQVMARVRSGEAQLQKLFAHYVENPGDLPPPWLELWQNAANLRKKNRVIADFIATGNIQAR